MGLKVDIQKKLSGFDLDIKFEASGKPLALLGASGSGKSMTLRCIAGLEKPDYGKPAKTCEFFVRTTNGRGNCEAHENFGW
jgi:ABC-type sulfate/molybdate transport systems ATPase subunit